MGILSFLGSAVGGLLGAQSAKKDRKLQEDAMQHGIQWKVEDAKRAGIHPIYALGAPTFSPSPVGTGGVEGAFANMGASLDDMMNKRKTGAVDAATARMEALTLDNASLQNDLLRVQIRKANAPGLPPAYGGSDPVSASTLTLPTGPFKTSPTTTAQRMEDEYSDVVGNIYGGARYGYDYVRNFADLVARAIKHGVKPSPGASPVKYPYGRWN